jgi:putative ATP-dependent endonuclease of the OLD family
MKIKTVSISNLLSFTARTDVETNPDITFDTHGTEGRLHILIGPNGSGKSNFVEVVTHCFRKALFLPTHFNEQNLIMEQRGGGITGDNLKQTINPEGDANRSGWSLMRHHQSPNANQLIKLILELNQNDFNNLSFLLDNRDTINNILNHYSSYEVNVPGDIDRDGLKECREVIIRIERTGAKEPTLSFENDTTLAIAFIKGYLQYFEVFQAAIETYNKYKKAPTDKVWPSLKRTFALLGSYRNYGSIHRGVTVDASMSFQQVNRRLREESTRINEGQEPAVFELVKRKIGCRYHDIFRECDQETTLRRLYEEPPLSDINKLLSKYLGLSIRVLQPTPYSTNLEIRFVRNGNDNLEVSELSSGEKGILHFLFTLYGFDLENGVLIIDEPELHLHPQIQREYLQIIEDIRLSLDMQFIMVTHSPIFVTKDTITNVYRFINIDGKTAILKPTITESQKTLAKILDLTSSAKIFFVRKAILVEGETDEYFWRFHLSQLKQSSKGDPASWKTQITDFEIFSIKGKGERAAWSGFLEKFGLQISFIGDWDNITEVTPVDIQSYEQSYAQAIEKAHREIQKKGSHDGANIFATIDKCLENLSEENLTALRTLKDYIVSRHVKYPTLIAHIQKNQPQEWNKIEQAIDQAYTGKIYILRRGELEDYLSLPDKGLDKVIEFCQNGYRQWLLEPAFKEHGKELERIAETIFA